MSTTPEVVLDRELSISLYSSYWIPLRTTTVDHAIHILSVGMPYRFGDQKLHARSLSVAKSTHYTRVLLRISHIH